MYGQLGTIKLANTDLELEGFPVHLPNPPKLAVLRLPTSSELLTYVIAIQQARNKRIGFEEVADRLATELFNKLRLDKGTDEFDPAEADYALNQLTRHLLLSCDRDGQNYIVTIRTAFGDVIHTIELPFQKDLVIYRRRAGKFPEGVLYDQYIRVIEGYTENDKKFVPPTHKMTVISAVESALAALDPLLDPNS